MKTVKSLILAGFLICDSTVAANMVKVEGGSYRPLYLKKDIPMISVKPYQIDKYLIASTEFSELVQSHPQWRRGKISPKRAEPVYLKHWVKNGSNNYAPRPSEMKHSITNVSWFVANAYCSTQGKRLPTIDEWEFAIQALATQKNGAGEPNYNRTILDWYADGGWKGLQNADKNKPNYWGVYDMHGLIWEWTEDFNSSQLISSSADSQIFCSGVSIGSSDPSNYAAFLCYGIRTSLQFEYVLHNLGFRYATK